MLNVIWRMGGSFMCHCHHRDLKIKCRGCEKLDLVDIGVHLFIVLSIFWRKFG